MDAYLALDDRKRNLLQVVPLLSFFPVSRETGNLGTETQKLSGEVLGCLWPACESQIGCGGPIRTE